MFVSDPSSVSEGVSEGRVNSEHVSQTRSVFIATLATRASGISVGAVRAVRLGLLPAPTFTSKIKAKWRKKAQL
jgi:hypothetical protein